MRPEETSLYTGHWVDGAGPLDAELLIVGQAPGELEALRETPFVGRAGQLLQRAVADAGLDWESLRRTNVVRCRPPGNRAPTLDEIEEYRPWLEEEIASMPRLKVIVACGNEAAYWFSGSTAAITRRRGIDFEWRPGIRVVLTVHPAYVLRNPQAYELLVQDLRRAATLLHQQPRVLVEDVRVEATGPVGSAVVDAELDGSGRVRLFGWAVDGVLAVSPAEAAPTVLLEHVIGHNVRVDVAWLRAAGARIGDSWDDTMVMAHLLDENRPVGLKDLALSVLGVAPYWLDVEPFLRDARKRDQIPWDVLARYCANDVAVTRELYGVFSDQLRSEPRLQNLYNRLLMPLSVVLLGMEQRGVPVDVRRCEELCSELEQEAEQVRREIVSIDPDASGLNLRSSEQVSAYLYGRRGLRPFRFTAATGRGATDERALKELSYLDPVPGLILRWRKLERLRQMVQSWADHTGPDGRCRPSYNITGTATGRLSGRDPNPQNLPTDPRVRSIVRAPEGYAIVSADYSTIELVVAGWIYGEESIVRLYREGADLHTETAAAILGRPPEDKEERKKFGKTPNFGLLYMQGAEGFREYAAKAGIRLSLEEAESIRRRWHSLYPGVQQGWRRIWGELERRGYVEAPGGRRRRTHQQTEAVNFPVQCTAAELTHVSALLYDAALRSMGGELLLHVHDSLVAMVPVERVPEAVATVRGIMAYDTPAWCARNLGYRLPFTPRVDVTVGRSWGEEEMHAIS